MSDLTERLRHVAWLAEEGSEVTDLAAAAADALEAAEAKLAAIRNHCQDNLKARSLGDYENGYDGACLDILDIIEEEQ